MRRQQLAAASASLRQATAGRNQSAEPLCSTAILTDEAVPAAFADWRSGLQPVLDRMFAPIAELGVQVQQTRRAASAYEQAAKHVAAFGEQITSAWAGMAADAFEEVLASFVEFLTLAGQGLAALAAHDQQLVASAVDLRVGLYRDLVGEAGDDHMAMSARLDEVVAQLGGQVTSWQAGRSELVAALAAAAAALLDAGADRQP